MDRGCTGFPRLSVSGSDEETRARVSFFFSVVAAQLSSALLFLLTLSINNVVSLSQSSTKTQYRPVANIKILSLTFVFHIVWLETHPLCVQIAVVLNMVAVTAALRGYYRTCSGIRNRLIPETRGRNELR